MNIFVNNTLFEVMPDINISDALAFLSIDTRNGIAIAVNNNVVSKVSWNDFELHADDKITIIKATQGG